MAAISRKVRAAMVLNIRRGGDAIARRRITKGQLVKEFYQRGGIMSPETGVKLQEGADDVKLNVAYMINDVDEVVTEVGAYNGFRVELLDIKGNLGSVMLWKRPVTSPKSKLGSFVSLLGSNTDKWLKKWIIFRGWQQGNRNVERTDAPVVAATKPKVVKPTKEAVPKVSEPDDIPF